MRSSFSPNSPEGLIVPPTTDSPTALSVNYQNFEILNGPGRNQGLPAKISGGVPPYTYAITNGPGSIQSATGLFTTPLSWATTTVKVSDSAGQSINLQVKNRPILVDGPVNTSTIDGDSLFLGGSFLSTAPQYNPYISIIETTNGALSAHDCNYKGKLNTGGFSNPSSMTIAGDYLYLSGRFDYATFDNEPVGNVIRIDLRTCTLDSIFNQKAKTVVGNVYKVLVDESTNSVYLGGAITSYDGQTANGLVKVSLATGQLDPAFDQSVGFNSELQTMKLHNGFLYVLGYFSTYRGSPAQKLAKIDASTGTLDTTFTQATGISTSLVWDLLILNSSLYVAVQGITTTYRGVNSSQLMKLDLTTGNLDTTFSSVPGFGSFYKVYSIATDGTALYVGGEFASYRGVACPRAIKIDPTSGAMISAFNYGTGAGGGGGFYFHYDATNSELYLLANGGPYNGVSGKILLKVDRTTGAPDPSFNIPLSNAVWPYVVDLAFLPGNKLAIGYGDASLVSGDSKVGFTKVNLATGEFDSTFNIGTGFNGTVYSTLVEGNYIYVGGSFTTYNGQPALRLAKINKNTGVLDTTFTQATGLTGAGTPVVESLASDGTGIFVCGYFNQYRGTTVQNLARVLISSGNLDTTFTQTTGVATKCSSIAYANSSLYIGGSFATYRGVAANYLAKVDAVSGVLDGTFTTVPGPNNIVNSVIADGTDIYAGGAFTTYRGTGAPYLIKVHPTSGILDTTFSQATNANTEVKLLGIFDFQAFATYGSFTSLSTYRGDTVKNLISVATFDGALANSYKTASGPNSKSATMKKYQSTYFLGGSFSSVREKTAPFFTPINPLTGEVP